MKNTPEMRFAGYTGAWERRKLGEVVNRVSAQSNADDLPKVEFEDIVSGEGRLNKDITNKFDNRKGILFEPGNILYGKLRPYLKNWLFADFNGIALGDFWVFESVCTAPIFNYYLIQTDKYQEIANLSTGTKMPRSDWNVVSDADFFIPSTKEEQTVIGEFFRTQDEGIRLHQRKLEGLREMKRGYLQQMFPQAGERAPRVRFAGFDGEWEQRRLGEVADVKMCRRIFNEETSASGDIPFYKIGTFGGTADAYITQEKFEEYKEKYPYPEIGDVLISAAGTIGRTVVYRGEKEYFQDSNIVWLKTDKTRLANIFLEQFYEIADWSGLEGTTIKRLYNATMLATMIKLPSLAEQAAIGEFFRTLDGQVEAQAGKVEQLKRLKAAYLQKMLV